MKNEKSNHKGGPAERPVAQAGQPVLEVKDVVMKYNEGEESELTVLKGINLKIEEGAFVAIMGPSGSGKTTLLDIIGCLLRPTSGLVIVDGEETNRLNSSELADMRGEHLGFIFQQYNLVQSLTALENVELPMRIVGKGKSFAKERATELLKIVGLGERLRHKPSQLSGGEQQRVVICRALANEPKIILGDEPTGNLDTKTGLLIMDILKKLNKEKGYTIVLVTHDRNIGNLTDRIINIKDGQIIKEERK